MSGVTGVQEAEDRGWARSLDGAGEVGLIEIMEIDFGGGLDGTSLTD